MQKEYRVWNLEFHFLKFLVVIGEFFALWSAFLCESISHTFDDFLLIWWSRVDNASSSLSTLIQRRVYTWNNFVQWGLEFRVKQIGLVKTMSRISSKRFASLNLFLHFLVYATAFASLVKYLRNPRISDANKSPLSILSCIYINEAGLLNRGFK